MLIHTEAEQLLGSVLSYAPDFVRWVDEQAYTKHTMSAHERRFFEECIEPLSFGLYELADRIEKDKTPRFTIRTGYPGHELWWDGREWTADKRKAKQYKNKNTAKGIKTRNTAKHKAYFENGRGSGQLGRWTYAGVERA